MALLEARLAERGETPRLLAALGTTQFRAEALDEALSTNERLLVLDPNAVVALNYIAYSLAEEGRDLERAAEYAERAVGMAPSASDVRDTLGWVYFRLGRYDEARRELEQAAALGSPDAVIHEHLGDALMALGLPEEARRAWQRALEIEPGRPSCIERLESSEGAPEGLAALKHRKQVAVAAPPRSSRRRAGARTSRARGSRSIPIVWRTSSTG